jgi:hypothetical protein
MLPGAAAPHLIQFQRAKTCRWDGLIKKGKGSINSVFILS